MTTLTGFEPTSTPYKGVALPLCYKAVMVREGGLEPPPRGPKPRTLLYPYATPGHCYRWRQ